MACSVFDLRGSNIIILDRPVQADEPALATVRQAVVLVGGRGTRLGPLTADTPKPLLEVGGRPFLGWLLRELCRYGVEDVLLLAGHLADRIEAAIPGIVAALPRRLAVTVLSEPADVPAGTGGALVRARHLLDDRVLVCNGDTLFDTNLAHLLADAAGDGPDVAGRMLLRRMAERGRYGAVRIAGDRVVAIDAIDASGAGPVTINTGIAVLRTAALDGAPATASLEADILAPLAHAGKLRATVADGWFCDIGVPDDLRRARAELAQRLLRPALILDRDGTINLDHGHVGTRDRFEWVTGARDAIRAAGDRGWHVFVATNQSGVGRGHYDEAAVRSLHGWMDDRVRAAGGTVDDWRFCPFHEQATVGRYRRASDWRKPGPGMLRDLAGAWSLDPASCVMVGDQPSDIRAATAAGMTGHLFTTGNLHAFVIRLLDNLSGSGRLPGGDRGPEC